ncbi:Response regulator receiver protein [Sulfitobacter noctilucicola]|uniref:CheY-like chemotaxis protein n=1 Tax=Sulfitobacter noctilucicola TaxID=1342301 RepID=A0A7W6M756_9RHOB|nr:response regulator [Sulfitobacter noctilucicola]KIN62154.1 Response regulator receiver protein [Sulfitobacter noctilucicola]MBB4173328.1 CheY-like chemotaxis protein [Sulfitobacter noctilucicola]
MTHPDAYPIQNLMLIDDNSFDQMIYQRISQKSGMVGNLMQFTDATKALEHLADTGKVRPDLILLDINMPIMDGFEFLEAVTEKFGADMCPIVVMLTTSLNPKDELRAKGFSVVEDFLNKPLTKAHLEKLSELVNGHKKQVPFNDTAKAQTEQVVSK